MDSREPDQQVTGPYHASVGRVVREWGKSEYWSKLIIAQSRTTPHGCLPRQTLADYLRTSLQFGPFLGETGLLWTARAGRPGVLHYCS
jgi:hypothetical protein